MSAPTSLFEKRRVVVCVGTGGVGKTTVAAGLALAAAQAGRRVLVMTIDPSRRLAQALGIDLTAKAAGAPLPVVAPDGLNLLKEKPFLIDELAELFLPEEISFLSRRRIISAFAWSEVISGASFSYAPVVKAATENLGFERGLFGEPIDGNRSRTEPTLLLFVLLTVPIRDNVARGRLVGLMGNRRGAGCCPPR